MKKFITGHNNNKLLILAAIFVFIILYSFFYPPMYTLQDEANYFASAHRLKEGTIYFDPLYAHKVVFNGTGYVDMYPPGMGFLLLPFAFIYWKTLFLLSPLLHIAAFLSFYALLKFLKIDTKLSLLYLFFPAFILYTRTLTADMVCASFFMIALYLYIKETPKNLFACGAILGLICLVKYSNFLIAAPLTLFLFLRERNKTKYIISGILPFALFILVYNHIAYGGIFKTGYRYIAAAEAFNFRYFPGNFMFYILALMSTYPFMLASAFFYAKEQRKEMFIIPLVMVMFFSMWHYVQVYPGQSFPGNLIVGTRLILPAIPLLLLSYVSLLDGIFKRHKHYYNLAVNTVVAALIICAFLISSHHQRYLYRLWEYKNIIYKNTQQDSLILCDGEVIKFLQNTWGKRKHVNFFNENLDTIIAQNNKIYLVELSRFDKEAEARAKSNAIEKIGKKYTLKPVYEKKDYFDLRIYKVIK